MLTFGIDLEKDEITLCIHDSSGRTIAIVRMGEHAARSNMQLLQRALDALVQLRTLENEEQAAVAPEEGRNLPHVLRLEKALMRTSPLLTIAPAPSPENRSLLAGPVEDLADEVQSAILPYLREAGRTVVDDAYYNVRDKFIADKEMLADQVVEAARPRLAQLVQELSSDPELTAKVGAAKAELEAGFRQSVIWTSILSTLGATAGVWLVLRFSEK